ncbi:MAG: hypothetical protein ACJAZ2_000941 [Glaciecola sp.]|jgi:hypothetical protein
MDRRHFLKISALGSIGLTSCWGIGNKKITIAFPIHVQSNMATGHKIMKAVKIRSSKTIKTETLIVGGGIAGLSAANSLTGKDFILTEMDDDFGGSSSAKKIGENSFSQGAHYDLSYPENYGKDALQLLEKLDIVGFNNVRNQYTFNDKEHLIPEEHHGICYTNKGFQDTPIKAGINKTDFINLLKPYVGHMKMPTRLIDQKYRGLNNISFYEFIDKYLIHDPALITGIDYQMIDDYGGNCSRVSALAGIHYYTCRDYYGENKPELFSPPEGNYYFIKKLIEHQNKDQLKASTIAFHIERKNNLYHTKTFNTKTETVATVVSKNILYAGQKNALKFIYPEYYPLFSNTSYAPWVAINFELSETIPGYLKWQNDILGLNNNLMGFVNAETQTNKDKVLTMYMCFDPAERKKMPEIMANPEAIVKESMSFLNEYFNLSVEEYITSAHIKVMGHAMPVPEKGYLFNDRNLQTHKDNFYFAGVDNGRLPLMFEALDSGIDAANYINS